MRTPALGTRMALGPGCSGSAANHGTGRRRVPKTFLVRGGFGERLQFGLSDDLVAFEAVEFGQEALAVSA